MLNKYIRVPFYFANLTYPYPSCEKAISNDLSLKLNLRVY